MSEPSVAFVTGATGFIGCRLTHELARRGHRVRALGRRKAPQPPPGFDQPLDYSDDHIELVLGDITQPDSLLRAMEGCTHVYHLAGYAKNWARDPQQYWRINVDGMCNVMEAARRLGVQRVVWTSTLMTIGPTKPGQVADESTPRTDQPCYTDYEASKIEAEKKAQAFVQDGLSVVTVNPTRVFGPGHLTEGNTLSKLIDDYDRGKAPILLNGGRNIGNYVLVDDVVEGHILAMEKGRDGQRYLLGGENLTLKQFFELIDEVSGRKHFKFTIRRPGALAFAQFQLWRARWFGVYPVITPPWVRTFLADWRFSIEKAQRELGYRPTPVKEGVRRTYEWLLKVRQETA